MEIFENIVQAHIQRDPNIFLRHQPVLGENWSCPDFLGVNFEKKEILVIEVTTAYNPNGLREKILNRETHWFSKIREEYEFLIAKGWILKVWAFVRKDAKGKFEEKFKNTNEVEIYSLETIPFPWDNFKSDEDTD